MDHGRSINGADDTPSTDSADDGGPWERRLAPRRVLLIGMMGSGKTTIGHHLAELTGWPYEDNDDLVRGVSGLGPDRLLEERGVTELRAAESKALGAALSAPVPIIASVAGGVVTKEEDCVRLRDGGFVVWLRAPLEVLVKRVEHGHVRPWLGDDPLAAMRKLYEGREGLYEEVATLVVDVSDRAPGEIAGEIFDALSAETTESPRQAGSGGGRLV